jgi:hypothetical protein
VHRYSLERIAILAPSNYGQPHYAPRNDASWAREGYSQNEIVYARIQEIATSASEAELVAQQFKEGQWWNLAP